MDKPRLVIYRLFGLVVAWLLNHTDRKPIHQRGNRPKVLLVVAQLVGDTTSINFLFVYLLAYGTSLWVSRLQDLVTQLHPKYNLASITLGLVVASLVMFLLVVICYIICCWLYIHYCWWHPYHFGYVPSSYVTSPYHRWLPRSFVMVTLVCCIQPCQSIAIVSMIAPFCWYLSLFIVSL